MFHYRRCMKPITKIVAHSVTVLLINGIIVKRNYSLFCWGPPGTLPGCLRVSKPTLGTTALEGINASFGKLIPEYLCWPTTFTLLLTTFFSQNWFRQHAAWLHHKSHGFIVVLNGFTQKRMIHHFITEITEHILCYESLICQSHGSSTTK